MDAVRERGASIVGLVVDSVETNATLARDAEIGFPVLSDPDLHVIDAYGLRHVAAHEQQDVSHSASVLVDGDGIVRWVFVTRNVRVRPLPSDVLAAIDALPRDEPHG
jgi:peroxiredoxin